MGRRKPWKLESIWPILMSEFQVSVRISDRRNYIARGYCCITSNAPNCVNIYIPWIRIYVLTTKMSEKILEFYKTNAILLNETKHYCSDNYLRHAFCIVLDTYRSYDSEGLCTRYENALCLIWWQKMQNYVKRLIEFLFCFSLMYYGKDNMSDWPILVMHNLSFKMNKKFCQKYLSILLHLLTINRKVSNTKFWTVVLFWQVDGLVIKKEVKIAESEWWIWEIFPNKPNS